MERYIKENGSPDETKRPGIFFSFNEDQWRMVMTRMLMVPGRRSFCGGAGLSAGRVPFR